MVQGRLYSSKENQALKIEMANALSHGIGLILAIAFVPLLFVKAVKSANSYLPLAISGYFFGLLMVFTFSTLYHATQNVFAKSILRRFDHISIFFLIGGTYLPFVVEHADPTRASWLLGIQWLIIFAGVIHKIWFTGKLRLLSSLVYIGLGGMVLGMGETFWSSLPLLAVYFLVAGGIVYVLGVFFYQVRKWQYNHFIWHLFVLAAAILHYLAVYFSF